jgi:hypothetical protein
MKGYLLSRKSNLLFSDVIFVRTRANDVLLFIIQAAIIDEVVCRNLVLVLE